MERTNSNTVRILRFEVGGDDRPTGIGSDELWAEFLKDNGRRVKLPVVGHINGICLAAGFVGTGGRHGY